MRASMGGKQKPLPWPKKFHMPWGKNKPSYSPKNVQTCYCHFFYSYSVVVEKVDERFQGSTLRPFSWRSLAALSRITANVSKVMLLPSCILLMAFVLLHKNNNNNKTLLLHLQELLLCYVIHPADLSEAELDSPACLSKLKVQVMRGPLSLWRSLYCGINMKIDIMLSNLVNPHLFSNLHELTTQATNCLSFADAHITPWVPFEVTHILSHR